MCRPIASSPLANVRHPGSNHPASSALNRLAVNLYLLASSLKSLASSARARHVISARSRRGRRAAGSRRHDQPVAGFRRLRRVGARPVAPRHLYSAEM